MKHHLKELVSIQIGYQFRRKAEPDPNGPYRVIQISDFDEGGRLKFESLERYDVEGSTDRYLIGPGDVLFLTRGVRQFAYAVTEHLAGTIATSYFFILRRIKPEVLPEFLAWSINHSAGRQSLQTSVLQGTHMMYVSRKAFEEMEIEVPPLAIQEKIVAIQALAQREQELLSQIADRRTKLVEIATQRAIHLSK